MYEGSLVDRYDEQSGYTHSGNWDVTVTTTTKNKNNTYRCSWSENVQFKSWTLTTGVEKKSAN